MPLAAESGETPASRLLLLHSRGSADCCTKLLWSHVQVIKLCYVSARLLGPAAAAIVDQSSFSLQPGAHDEGHAGRACRPFMTSTSSAAALGGNPTHTRLLKEFCTSGVSVASATVLTNPIDVVKTRIQLRPAATLAGTGNGAGAAGSGLVATGVSIARNEGLTALWKGVSPAVARALLYGGLRLGMYTPTKELITQLTTQQQQQQSHHPQLQQQPAGRPPNSSNAPPPTSSSSSSSSGQLLVKVTAGVTSGGVAAALCNPTELVKVRLQACAGRGPGSSWGVVQQVVATDGVAGLWKGAGPGLVRAAVLTASQCATYDEVKARLKVLTGWGEHLGTHLACALVTGLVSTTATNPVDVIKTHMFTGGGRYHSAWHCAADVYGQAGAAGFWRGWAANYARIGPQTVVTLVVAEKLRQLAGLASL